MKRNIIPYNPKLKELARKLRNNSTKSEIRLWQHLKGKQLHGYDFYRQKPLLNYIADFYCYELNLVIELDGYSHHFGETVEKDEIKQWKSIGNTVNKQYQAMAGSSLLDFCPVKILINSYGYS